MFYVQTPVPAKPADFTIVEDTFNIQPGQYRYFTFSVEAPATFAGNFYVAGPNWCDARVILTDPPNKELFQANQEFRFVYDSGPMRRSSTTKKLSAGQYVLIFSNLHSLAAQAPVTASFRIHY